MDFFGIGPLELLVILVVALLVLGPKQLPQMARRLGLYLTQARQSIADARQKMLVDLEAGEPQEPRDPQGGEAPSPVERRPPH